MRYEKKPLEERSLEKTVSRKTDCQDKPVGLAIKK